MLQERDSFVKRDYNKKNYSIPKWSVNHILVANIQALKFLLQSSLLLTILKELPLISGEIRINGRLAYVSQQAWVLPESIKENIVFGNEFNETKYKKIVQACALDKVSSI